MNQPTDRAAQRTFEVVQWCITDQMEGGLGNQPTPNRVTSTRSLVHLDGLAVGNNGRTYRFLIVADDLDWADLVLLGPTTSAGRPITFAGPGTGLAKVHDLGFNFDVVDWLFGRPGDELQAWLEPLFTADEQSMLIEIERGIGQWPRER